MNARLICISVRPHYEISLSADVVTIGRDPSNSVHLDDPTVSSHHCRIEYKSDRFVLIDCESTNGTFLNGQATREACLQHGDRISIGHSEFCFVIGETSDLAVAAAGIADAESGVLLSSQTIQLDPRESMYLKATFARDIATLERVSHDMGVLLRFGSEISEIDDSRKLQEVLLDRIFEVVQAETGVILLGSDVERLLGGSPVSRRETAGEKQIEISRTIVEQVFKSGVALLCNDLLADQGYSESIVASRIHSVLAVPLIVMNSTIGVIYLATTNPGTAFDEGNLQLITALAGITSVALEHVRYVEWLETENRQLTREINARHNMVGESPKMQKIYEAISLLAPTDSPVLILGESGTGKELAARAIHSNSNRSTSPFVVVNCGAIAESLFISEMFGYVRGAFTGADRDKKGLMEEADGGTLFLDELGELSLHNQAALLRAVEERRILRVGSTQPTSVDVRLIFATNRQLKDEMNKGGFRADLYYRMGLPLELPPLRDRLEDIPLLVRFFLQQYGRYTQREIGSTPPDTIRALQEYSWPGNIRELGAAIQWAVVFGKSDRIRPEELPPYIANPKGHSSASATSLEEAMRNFERQFILRALEETKGNVVEAAALLVRASNYLQRRISQLDLRDELERIRQR